MADSILDEKRQYNPEPSLAGQVGVAVKDAISELNYQHAEYKPKIMLHESYLTEEQKKNEETARKFNL